MPATVTTGPLSVQCVFSDATRYTLLLDAMPCPELAADLAVGLAALVHPHGDLDALATVRRYRGALRRLCEFVSRSGFTGAAPDLTRSRLVEFWLACRPEDERQTRAVLRAMDEESVALQADVRQYLAGPALHRLQGSTPLEPYSDRDWQTLMTRCTTIAETAFAAHKAALAEARDGDDPRTGGWKPRRNRLWLLHREGPLTATEISDYLGWGKSKSRIGGSHVEPSTVLFPTVDVVIASQLLLGMTTGIVPDGLADLGLDGIDWAGDTTVLLTYIKGRTRREALNLPATAVRVLRRWLEHSALLRRFAAPSDQSRLWLTYRPRGQNLSPGKSGRVAWSTTVSWTERHDVRDEDGGLFIVHRPRIRTTFEQRRDKSTWTGRTTIDPNHSAQVEGDHYLSPRTSAQRDAVNVIVEQAQHDLVRRAFTSHVLGSETVEHAAAALPARIEGLEMTGTVLQELVGGRRDVFTAACGDQLAGLHGPAGKPCPARPWVCLLCPLAIFAPRHAGNLLRLKAFFARQFQAMTVPQFMAVFGPYAHRLDTEILPQFAAPVLAAAAAEVTGSDAELPLRPEETTS